MFLHSTESPNQVCSENYIYQPLKLYYELILESRKETKTSHEHTFYSKITLFLDYLISQSNNDMSVPLHSTAMMGTDAFFLRLLPAFLFRPMFSSSSFLISACMALITWIILLLLSMVLTAVFSTLSASLLKVLSPPIDTRSIPTNMLSFKAHYTALLWVNKDISSQSAAAIQSVIRLLVVGSPGVSAIFFLVT